jgi:cytochrome c553
MRLRWSIGILWLLTFTRGGMLSADGQSAAGHEASDAGGQSSESFDAAKVERGKRLWIGRAACSQCHGWAGNGEAQEPYPAGADLRKSSLNLAQMTGVIRCGRPGTRMPHFDAAAYSDQRCYGATAQQLEDNVPPLGASLRAAEIEAVAIYVLAQIEGRGPITAGECTAYFGSPAGCDRYPGIEK